MSTFQERYEDLLRSAIERVENKVWRNARLDLTETFDHINAAIGRFTFSRMKFDLLHRLNSENPVWPNRYLVSLYLDGARVAMLDQYLVNKNGCYPVLTGLAEDINTMVPLLDKEALQGRTMLYFRTVNTKVVKKLYEFSRKTPEGKPIGDVS